MTEPDDALRRVARALGGPGSYSRQEVSERTGVPLRVLQARDEALGLRDTGDYTDTDLADAEALKELLEAVGSQALMRTSRADAALVRQIALTHLLLVRDEILTPLLAETEGDIDAAADSLAELADPMLDRATTLLASTYRRILIDLLASEVVALGLGGDDTVTLAVGFVDVVGYTSLTARVDPAALRGVLERFEERCHSAATNRDAQLVKFLGDAALYVSPDPCELAEILLDLVDPEGEDAGRDDAGLSAGLGFGDLVVRAGDVFGEPVNLAARLTDVAVGGSLVADEELGDRLAERFSLSRLPSTKLHGIGRRRPVRVRRREDD